ncbi:MAG: DUF3365 domain-containing protein [Gammaproteobacteria bacterium]|nr:DUF3365 domain-containing protein [Gammaproteobacteria bacterium]
MKQLVMIVLTCLMGVQSAMGSDTEQALADSRATVGEFMKTLKQELQAAMQAGGPVNAVSVCNLTAPGIANTYSAREGREVSRTSLRVRNPGNAPVAWQRAVLESFEQRKQAGEDVTTLEFHEVVTTDGVRELRYMKAIPTAKVCLACHGETVDSTVKARLEILYPNDQAMGYRVGDIRGAFSVTQTLCKDQE